MAITALNLLTGSGLPATLPPVVVVFGDDGFLKRASIDRVAQAALETEDPAPELRRFEGASVDLATVLDEVRTLPFLAPRRVVEVREADPFITAHRKELESYLDHPAKEGVLILVPKSWTASTKLAKAVEKVGLAIDAKSPREPELVKFLSAWCERTHQTNLPGQAAGLLVDLIGPETGPLVAEVGKLAAHAGSAGRITTAQVEDLVASRRVETIWKILDAATSGQGDLALGGLRGLLDAREPVPKLMAGMAFALAKTHHAGQLRSAGLDGRSACRRAGVRDFLIEKTLAQHRHLGPDRVAKLPAMLLKADLDTKGGSQLPPEHVLERLLVELIRPRQDESIKKSYG